MLIVKNDGMLLLRNAEGELDSVLYVGLPQMLSLLHRPVLFDEGLNVDDLVGAVAAWHAVVFSFLPMSFDDLDAFLNRSIDDREGFILADIAFVEMVPVLTQKDILITDTINEKVIDITWTPVPYVRVVDDATGEEHVGEALDIACIHPCCYLRKPIRINWAIQDGLDLLSSDNTMKEPVFMEVVVKGFLQKISDIIASDKSRFLNSFFTEMSGSIEMEVEIEASEDEEPVGKVLLH